MQALADQAAQSYRDSDSSAPGARAAAFAAAREYIAERDWRVVDDAQRPDIVIDGDNVVEQALLLRATAQVLGASSWMHSGAKTAFGHMEEHRLGGSRAAIEATQVMYGMFSEVLPAIPPDRRRPWAEGIISSLGVRLPEPRQGEALFVAVEPSDTVDDFIASVQQEDSAAINAAAAVLVLLGSRIPYEPDTDIAEALVTALANFKIDDSTGHAVAIVVDREIQRWLTAMDPPDETQWRETAEQFARRMTSNYQTQAIVFATLIPGDDRDDFGRKNPIGAAIGEAARAASLLMFADEEDRRAKLVDMTERLYRH